MNRIKVFIYIENKHLLSQTPKKEILTVKVSNVNGDRSLLSLFYKDVHDEEYVLR